MLSNRPKGKIFLTKLLIRDAIQLMKMEENVRKLESQLKDSFKGQMDSLQVVKENMDLTEKLRELEKKANMY